MQVFWAIGIHHPEVPNLWGSGCVTGDDCSKRHEQVDHGVESNRMQRHVAEAATGLADLFPPVGKVEGGLPTARNTTLLDFKRGARSFVWTRSGARHFWRAHAPLARVALAVHRANTVVRISGIDGGHSRTVPWRYPL